MLQEVAGKNTYIWLTSGIKLENGLRLYKFGAEGFTPRCSMLEQNIVWDQIIFLREYIPSKLL